MHTTTLCEPVCQLSVCDTEVLLTDTNHNNEDFKLLVWKGNKRICDYELTSDNTGKIYLTDTEILEFSAEGQTFKIQLRDSENNVVDLDYFDCNGNEQKADKVRIKFIECEVENTALYETC